MTINYDHSRNLHTVLGPAITLPILFEGKIPRSLLDIGCGVGTWLKAALEYGVNEVQGIDGVKIPEDKLLFPKQCFQQLDLAQPIHLGRRFEAAICLEVGEHIDAEYAGTLVDSLIRHTDIIYFSAACPSQPGQNHVNNQWPAYWQSLFNERQYICTDEVRWRIWDDERIEPWYRQNIFAARNNPTLAGKEPRVRAVVHPDVFKASLQASATLAFPVSVEQIEAGRMPLPWYFRSCATALLGKLRRWMV